MTIKTTFAALALLLGAMTGAAQAESIYEVEGARANARAGGPVSEHDAFLLERYGALSGTPEWRHRVRDRYVIYYDDVRPLRRNHRVGHRHRVYRD
jgi:hypothetical protein